MPGVIQEFVEWTAAGAESENSIASNPPAEETYKPEFEYGDGIYPESVTDQYDSPVVEPWWPENDNSSDPNKPKYDSWWAQAIELTADESDPPILGEDWNDPEKFDVQTDIMDDDFQGCVDLNF